MKKSVLSIFLISLSTGSFALDPVNCAKAFSKSFRFKNIEIKKSQRVLLKERFSSKYIYGDVLATKQKSFLFAPIFRKELNSHPAVGPGEIFKLELEGIVKRPVMVTPNLQITYEDQTFQEVFVKLIDYDESTGKARVQFLIDQKIELSEFKKYRPRWVKRDKVYKILD